MSELLGEARVIIRPDTTRFRAELTAQLAAATKGITAPIPVAVTTAGDTAAQAVQAARQTAAAQVAGARSALQATAATDAFTRSVNLNAAAQERLAGIEEAMSLTTTRLAASRARLREINAAAILSERALVAAIGTGNATIVAAQANLTNLVRATRELAVVDVQAAIAENELSAASTRRVATQNAVTKGVLAQSAAVAGLRGSVIGVQAPFLAGTAAVVAFAKALGLATSLEQNLAVLQAVTGATGDEMERVSDIAKQLGRDITLPGVAAQDAAVAITELSKAGLSLEDSLAGARGVLQLATAAQIENAQATEITASALNAFQLSGEAAVNVADLLTNAANAAQGSIADMGLALRQSAGIADLVGFSLDETVSLLTILARAGLRGSDAGTSLRVALLRLINPTDEAADALDRLNVNLRDAQGNLRPEVFFELSDALSEVSKAQAQATLATIFGADASRAAAFLGRENAQAFRQLTTELNRQGAALEVAGARMAGLGGSAENLKNQLAALGTEVGELASPLVELGVDVTAEFFGLLAEQVAASRKEIASFAEDAEKLQDFLSRVSSDSGFSDFLSDVSSGAQLVVGDISRASDATDDFIASLFGIGGGASQTARSIDALTREEIEFAQSLTDSHDRVDLQVRDLERLATAAQRAAGTIARLTGQLAGIQEQVTRARIAGDEGAELDLLEQERERLQRLLAIEEGIVAEGGRGAATARRRIREQILPQLESVSNEIRAILQQQVTESENLRREAEAARRERDQNILDALGLREARASNAVIEARATEALQDDLRAQIALRNFFKRSIVEIRKTVQDAQTRREAIAAATRDLITAQQDVEDTREQIKEALRQERREERERQRESLALDVQIAQATGNRRREIQAREAEIDFIQEQIRQTRKGSNQRKRLILELRQAQKELRELRGEREKTAQAFRELTFSFLQTQQGFAANLLGNLIPGGATAGLVGGVSPTAGLAAPQITPGAQAQQDAAVAAGRDLGFSRGQGNETNAILRSILNALLALNGRAGHPEARYQRATQSAFMDVIGT